MPGALATGALVIEDLAPSDIDERALFHLLNLARQEEADVLMTARTQPAGWALELPDLLSRLRAVPVVTLAPPDDALLRALIVKLCIDRQLSVDEALVNYVASRIERSFAAARRPWRCSTRRRCGCGGRSPGRWRRNCCAAPAACGLTPRGGVHHVIEMSWRWRWCALIEDRHNGAPPTSADLHGFLRSHCSGR